MTYIEQTVPASLLQNYQVYTLSGNKLVRMTEKEILPSFSAVYLLDKNVTAPAELRINVEGEVQTIGGLVEMINRMNANKGVTKSDIEDIVNKLLGK